jgi:hypothetical protein
MSAICGFIGSVTVIALIFRCKKLLTTTSTRLVFFQTMCYLVEALFSFALPSDAYLPCIVQAAVVEYTILASVLWACVMIYVLHSILRRRPGARLAYNPDSELVYFHALCWLLPLPFAFAPLITRDYGQVNDGDAWCWVLEDQTSGQVLRLVHYCFYWVLIIFIGVMSARVLFLVSVCECGHIGYVCVRVCVCVSL